MRIIGGEARGRSIRAPRGERTRPTTDRVRESLFSLLGDLHDLNICDGFAGSGALGLESLSRGARYTWFFDLDRLAIRAVEDNLELLGWEDRATVRQLPFEKGVFQIEDPLDVVFLDPPYEKGLDATALEALAATSACRRDALVVVERSIRDPELRHWGFDHDEDRIYGDTILSFYYRNANSESLAGG